MAWRIADDHPCMPSRRSPPAPFSFWPPVPVPVAQAAADAGTSLNDIIVTATRVAEPLELALEPILVINRAELADSLAIDVGDVLRYHAGIDTRPNRRRGPAAVDIHPRHQQRSVDRDD